MKKTKFFGLIVVICIMLSFFSISQAAETTNFNVGASNCTDVNEDANKGSTTITAEAIYESNGQISAVSFTPKGTGVFTIDVKGLTKYTDKELYFILTDSKGKEVRLAGYFDDVLGFTTFTSGNNKASTSVDVLLFAGETYTIKLSDKKASPDSINQTYAASSSDKLEYQINLSVNKDANKLSKVYQSDISSRVKSEDGKTYLENIEAPSSEYLFPEGATVYYDDRDVWDDVGDGLNAIGSGIQTLWNEAVANPFEEVICELLLSIGDYITNLLNYIVGEEVTVTALIYNQVEAVNPNFFDSSVSSSGINSGVKDIINKWFNIFKLIAIAVYIVVLLVIGLHILVHSTGKGMAKAKELFTEWVKGIAIFVLIPYLIKYAFLINESIVGMLRESADVSEYKVGTTFGGDEWSQEEIEFRSPQFVSKYTGTVAFGSEEVSEAYVKKIPTYQHQLDLMRIMRAYAGITKRFIYSVIWFILIGQLIVFVVQYYKRYFMIAFLIAMFPLICIFQAITIAQGKKPKEIGSWAKELLTNIFIQLVHAIVYTVITGFCVAIVKKDILSGATLNWLLIILSINFVSDGEKLLRKIVGSIGDGGTVGGTGQSAKGIKGAYHKAKSNWHRLTTGTHPKEDKGE
ncbi:MAG: hypothetical protein J6C46_04745 [Clostridia bacterium]|nr:hypothetical protein [Clostridia bacterium]